MPHEIITDASILDMCLHHCLRPYYQNRCLRDPFERAANIETCRSRLFRGGHLSSEESLPTPGTIFALDKKKRMKKKSHQYISVMGTMGSGKTTAARLIADHFHYHLIEENFGENAFLPRFYKTMDRWAFHSQTFYLMEKITQMMETKTLVEKVSVVQDTPLVQDVFSYAKAQHVMHHMDDAEWRLYQKIYTSFLPYIPVPDCIVYLKTSVPVVQKRIASRGRGYEQAIPKAYVSLLESLNESWLRDQHSIPVITIETDTLNIVKSSKARELFLSQLSFSHS